MPQNADRAVDAWLAAGGGARAGARRSGARGIRNNNPGNIRPGQHFLGEVGDDGENYAVFDTPEHGIRAMAVDLLSKYEKRGLVTIRAIITRYAPPEDNNDTAAYIAAVSRATGFDADAWLHLRDGTVLHAMVESIIRHENGIRQNEAMPYTDGVVDAGVALALGA